ncbi:MAG: hypothetical protein H5T41_00705 [Methanomassiliicoccales archaeon]|nr:hypothetical protein [Methanomassiliicoccales archaeon]
MDHSSHSESSVDLGSLWDVFTRREEYELRFRDRYNRFPFYMSRSREIFSPLVSQFLYDSGFRPDWPDGHDFAVCLTHDIDRIFTSFSDIAGRAARSLLKKEIMKSGVMSSLLF